MSDVESRHQEEIRIVESIRQLLDLKQEYRTGSPEDLIKILTLTRLFAEMIIDMAKLDIIDLVQDQPCHSHSAPTPEKTQTAQSPIT